MPFTDRAHEVRATARSTSRRARRAISGEPGGPGWFGTTLIAVLTGAAGAIVAFLFDPARGRSRRARLMDQGGATVRRTVRGAGRTIRATRATASGAIAAATRGGSGGETFPDDVTLASKVESQLFRDQSVPKGSININVERGIVVLRGEVPDAEMRDRLASEAAAIGGVWSVHNLLHLPGQPIEEEPIGARS
jgi:hypothetical protein